MKTRILIPAILLAAAAVLTAQDGTTVYTEGWVDLKSYGETYELMIGETVSRGDSVITGHDGFVELEMENRSTVKISPDTIYEIREIETPRGKESVLACTMGRVGFKFNQMTREPRIATTSVVGGVRGTEFELVTGSDGSSFIAVTQGQVDISSGGETLSLMANEGAEVKPGEAPGEKINLLEKELDFDAWSREKAQLLVDDPMGTLQGARKQLSEFYGQITLLMDARQKLMDEQDLQRVKLEEIRSASEDKAAVSQFYREHIKPLEVETMAMSFNVRYYALSALSLRRHVLGSLYTQTKSRNILQLEGEAWQNFKKAYDQVLTEFSETVYPYLVEKDF